MNNDVWRPGFKGAMPPQPGTMQWLMDTGQDRAKARRQARKAARRGTSTSGAIGGAGVVANTSRARAKLAGAQSALEHGSLQRAHDYYLAALELDPIASVRSLALSGLAHVLVLAGDSAAAAPLIDEALALDPANAQAHALRAR